MTKIKKRNSSATKTRFSPLTVILLMFLILYAAVLVGLLFWAFMTSFKSQAEFRLNIVGFPKDWVWNYTFVFEMFTVPVDSAAGTVEIGMDLQFLYSILYSVGCAFAATVTPCITAYLCARFPYKFGKVVYLIVIVTMVIPIVGNLPSEIQVARIFGLYDQIWGLWIMKANFLGMYFLVFYGVFKGIPKEYAEAAKVDGAGNFSILFRIMLPMVRNTFFVVMLIKFIEFWNDYQTPLIYLKSYPTIAYGVFYMANSRENGLSTVPMRMTSAMLAFIPVFVLFMVFQKKLVGNLTVGGIKG